MSIRASAVQMHFRLFNTDRTHTNPLVKFADWTPTSEFSFSFWLKANIPAATHGWIWIRGTNGSIVYFYPSGGNLQLEIRNTATGIPIPPVGVYGSTLGPLVYERWTCYYVSKDSTGLKIWRGEEGEIINPDNPVPLTLIMHLDNTVLSTLNFVFNDITGAITPYADICNLKYWNYAVTDFANIVEMVNTWWDSGAMWASPLRTPGDIASVATQTTSPYWHEQHAFSEVGNPQYLTMGQNIRPGSIGSDPAYLGKHRICPTWIYPRGLPEFYPFGDPLPNPDPSAPPGSVLLPPTITFDPALTPLIPTTHKSLEFVDMHDKGAVPETPIEFNGISYLGYPSNDGNGIGQQDSWPLYKDETGAEFNPNFSDPTQRFEQDTSVVAPPELNPANMYKWRYGAQFTWVPVTPQQAAAKAILSNMFLYVTYVGHPTGRPGRTIQDFTGLFILKRVGRSSDSYNRDVEVKIPDPTIKTALVGE